MTDVNEHRNVLRIVFSLHLSFQVFLLVSKAFTLAEFKEKCLYFKNLDSLGKQRVRTVRGSRKENLERLL
jgi:uncharacterized protein YrrD